MIFTSNFRIAGHLPQAVAISRAPVIYVANLMTEPGETSGLDMENHLAAISAFARVRISAVIASRVGICVKASAFAEFTRRSRCCSRRKIRPA